MLDPCRQRLQSGGICSWTKTVPANLCLRGRASLLVNTYAHMHVCVCVHAHTHIYMYTFKHVCIYTGTTFVADEAVLTGKLRTIREIDDALTRRCFGFDSVDDYYRFDHFYLFGVRLMCDMRLMAWISTVTGTPLRTSAYISLTCHACWCV